MEIQLNWLTLLILSLLMYLVLVLLLWEILRNAGCSGLNADRWETWRVVFFFLNFLVFWIVVEIKSSVIVSVASANKRAIAIQKLSWQKKSREEPDNNRVIGTNYTFCDRRKIMNKKAFNIILFFILLQLVISHYVTILCVRAKYLEVSWKIVWSMIICSDHFLKDKAN